MNRNAFRCGPNSLCSCTAYTASIFFWIVCDGIDGSKISTLGPNSGFVAFAATAGAAVVALSRASCCCEFNDDKDNTVENSRAQDENRTNLSFMSTPSYNGYDLFRKDRQTIALIRNNSRATIPE